ncbi:hypothetical protein [Phytohabitans rumicis]|uniref:Uncharacterized protein n=1 Tax=Phytohabitans rumicis TaxID=1076125 RepID=A0A6V8L469_9ACTN|nr:hypothetical protein [Phytohabitans rumicis]GFJ87465.1 hypothetical protein Prum_011070 [Phytohabitans rumicis]
MATKRGPDYASLLTEAEQRTLDELLAHARTRAGTTNHTKPRSWARPPSRSRWLAVVGSAVSVLVLAGVGTTIRIGLTDRGDAPGGSSAAAVLAKLAASASNAPAAAFAAPDALFGSPDPAGPAFGGQRQRTVDIVVTGAPGPCWIDAVEAEVRADSTGSATSAGGRLRVEQITLPSVTMNVAGCTGYGPSQPVARPMIDKTTEDLADLWAQARKTFPALGDYVSPNWTVADVPATPKAVSELIDAASESTVDNEPWWRWLTAAFASPELSPAQHGAALRLAAQTEKLVLLSTDAPTLTGLRGVKLRVPGGAELIFEPRTGVLLQRSVVRQDRGVAITIYRR